MNDIEIKYLPNGKLYKKSYFNDERKIHREDGPAKITYYDTGNICEVHYFVNNKRHRENEPAHIHYYNDGEIKFEFYYNNNRYHNAYGPAYFVYNREVNIKVEKWFYRGIEYTHKVNKWLNYNNIDYKDIHMNFNLMWMEVL